MTTVLITGANGQLGSEFRYLQSSFNHVELLFTDIEELDVLNSIALAEFIENVRPDYIVNCAAFTNVDGAEENGVAAYELNALAVRSIGAVAEKFGVGCIHISTDYVFSGEGKMAYTEKDIPKPINVYGLTKYLGEYELCSINPPNSLIIRTSWLYSTFGKNFVNTIVNLSKNKSSISVVDDQYGSPTYARDLAKAILKILPYKNNMNVEIFNFANKGTITWYDFAEEIVEQLGNDCDIIPVTTEQFSSKAKRPKFSTLNTDKFELTFQTTMRPWKESLKNCIIEMNKNQSK